MPFGHLSPPFNGLCQVAFLRLLFKGSSPIPPCGMKQYTTGIATSLRSSQCPDGNLALEIFPAKVAFKQIYRNWATIKKTCSPQGIPRNAGRTQRKIRMRRTDTKKSDDEELLGMRQSALSLLVLSRHSDPSPGSASRRRRPARTRQPGGAESFPFAKRKRKSSSLISGASARIG